MEEKVEEEDMGMMLGNVCVFFFLDKKAESGRLEKKVCVHLCQRSSLN